MSLSSQYPAPSTRLKTGSRESFESGRRFFFSGSVAAQVVFSGGRFCLCTTHYPSPIGGLPTQGARFFYASFEHPCALRDDAGFQETEGMAKEPGSPDRGISRGGGVSARGDIRIHAPVLERGALGDEQHRGRRRQIWRP